jgi:uncharacterized protein YdhG (YjbR/CyaY superfamily)
MEKSDTVDAYINSLPEDLQSVTQKLRSDLKKMVPEAQEKMAYGIPTLTLNGNLIHFAAYKTHVGLYPGSKAIVALAKDLVNYHTSKGTIQFPIDKDLPLELIKKVVEFCVEQNAIKKAKP